MKIAFVCQCGPIEAKAVLLASSIRTYLEPDIKLFAAHPRYAGDLSRATTTALVELGVEILPIQAPAVPSYPIGHKFAALALTAGSCLGIFLDSDIVAMRRPAHWPSSLSMVPATHGHHDRQVWDHAYGRFGLTVPAAKTATLVTGDDTAPYFNAGMIAAPGDAISAVVASWIDTAVQLDADPVIPPSSKRPYLDQLSIPVAAARLGSAIEALHPQWNLAGWAFSLSGREAPLFFHYQHWERLREQPEGAAIIANACKNPSVRAALADVPK